MPATNFTKKLKLGTYQGNDSISPLVTENENMEKIDAFAQGVDNQFAITQNQVNSNTTNIQVNAEGISDLDGRVKVIEGKVPDYDANLVTVAGLAGEVDTLQTDMTTAKTDIVNVTQEANTNTTNITAINTKLAEELPFPLAIDTTGGMNTYGWKTSTTGPFTPFANVQPFNLATQGEGEDKQYGYTNDAGEFVPFDIGADFGVIASFDNTTSRYNIICPVKAGGEYDVCFLSSYLSASTAYNCTLYNEGEKISITPTFFGVTSGAAYLNTTVTAVNTGNLTLTFIVSSWLHADFHNFVGFICPKREVS